MNVHNYVAMFVVDVQAASVLEAGPVMMLHCYFHW